MSTDAGDDSNYEEDDAGSQADTESDGDEEEEESDDEDYGNVSDADNPWLGKFVPASQQEGSESSEPKAKRAKVKSKDNDANRVIDDEDNEHECRRGHRQQHLMA